MLLAIHTAVYGSRPTTGGAENTDYGSAKHVALRRCLEPGLFYAGRNVYFGDMSSRKLLLVVDVAHKREFANFEFPLFTDYLANKQAINWIN